MLYLHQKAATAECKRIFEILSTLETQQGRRNAYVLENGISATRLLAIACALMAHPLLRDAGAAEFMSKLDVTDNRLDEIKRLDSGR